MTDGINNLRCHGSEQFNYSYGLYFSFCSLLLFCSPFCFNYCDTKRSSGADRLADLSRTVETLNEDLRLNNVQN